MLWSTSCGVELWILYHIIAANDSGALGRWEHGDIELLTSILRLLLLGSMAIRYLLCWHIDSIRHTTQITWLLNGELEANHSVDDRLPLTETRFPWLLQLSVNLPRFDIFPSLNTFRRLLLHVWPESTTQQLFFLSRILLVILQRIINILLPYQSAKFMECLFQLHGKDGALLAPTRHALYTLLLLGVLETCFIALQSPMWCRIVQACRCRLSDASFRSIFPLPPYWHQQHNSSEKSLMIGKSRGPDKYIDGTLFGIVPALTELGLAIGCAFQLVGLYYASMLALNSGSSLMISLWSAGRAAKLESAKEDAKHDIVNVRLVGC
jgi:hypothetical protein